MPYSLLSQTKHPFTVNKQKLLNKSDRFSKIAKSKTENKKTKAFEVKNKPNQSLDEIFKATLINFGSTDKNRISVTTSAGQTIVIGTTNANGLASDFCLASYLTNSNGQLNTSFGTRGVTTTDFASILTNNQVTGSNDIPKAAAIQTNGSIVVAGTTNASNAVNGSNNTSNFALARYTPNGQLDTSFGTNGVVLTDIALVIAGGLPGSNDKVVALRIQNNSIFVAGYSSFSANFVNSSFSIAKYTNNGVLDTSFGEGGTGVQFVNFATILSSTTTTASIDRLTSFQILPNGKIVLCGFSNARDPNFDFAVARLNSDGSLDTSFGINGSGVQLTNISSVIGTST